MAGHTDNAIVIDAPPDLVWSVTNDVGQWPDLLSDYSGAEVLEQDGDRVLLRLTRHAPDGESWNWRFEWVRDRPAGVARGRRVDLGPFRFMRVEWTYAEVDGGTRLRWVQEFAMREHAPFDEETMARMIDTNSAVELRRIKAYIEHLVAGSGDPAQARIGR